MVLRLAIALLTVTLAIALLVEPGLFPGAPEGRVPVIVGLVLLAALNFMRLSRTRQAQRRMKVMDQIPKKPLGL